MNRKDDLYTEAVETAYDDYGEDQGSTIELLDDIDAPLVEEDDTPEEVYSPEDEARNNLKKWLDTQLKNYNELNRSTLNVYYKGKSYQIIVMGKSKMDPNRYVFKIQDGTLKAFDITDMKV